MIKILCFLSVFVVFSAPSDVGVWVGVYADYDYETGDGGAHCSILPLGTDPIEVLMKSKFHSIGRLRFETKVNFALDEKNGYAYFTLEAFNCSEGMCDDYAFQDLLTWQYKTSFGEYTTPMLVSEVKIAEESQKILALFFSETTGYLNAVIRNSKDNTTTDFFIINPKTGEKRFLGSILITFPSYSKLDNPGWNTGYSEKMQAFVWTDRMNTIFFTNAVTGKTFAKDVCDVIGCSVFYLIRIDCFNDGSGHCLAFGNIHPETVYPNTYYLFDIKIEEGDAKISVLNQTDLTQYPFAYDYHTVSLNGKKALIYADYDNNEVTALDVENLATPIWSHSLPWEIDPDGYAYDPQSASN